MALRFTPTLPRFMRRRPKGPRGPAA
jgi:hypothetical protein